MTPDDPSPEQPLDQLDALTPAQVHRFQLWRAMVELSRAQANGQLTQDQVQMLTSLADNLQQLATQLSQLADLGQQAVQLLDSGRVPSDSASDTTDD